MLCFCLPSPGWGIGITERYLVVSWLLLFVVFAAIVIAIVAEVLAALVNAAVVVVGLVVCLCP